MKDWIRSVLIVHSDIHVAKALASSIVEGHEVYVYIAGMGARVREFLRSIGVDLVIASQKLPDMTGMELFSQLSRSNPWVRRVLLLSGEDEVNGDDAVSQGLIHYYMIEPIETPAFLHIIKENIQGKKAAGGPETEAPGHDESPVYPPDGRGAGQPEERPGSTWEWEETSSRAVHVAPVEHPVEGLCPESGSSDQSLGREPGVPSDDVASAHDQRHAEPERAKQEEIASEILQDRYPEEEAPTELLEEQEELFREAEAVLEQRPIDYQERRDADEGEHADDARGWVEAASSAVLESETLPMEPLAEPVPKYRDELGADRVAEYAGSTGESDELVSEAGPMTFEEQPEVVREPEVSVVDQSGLQEPEPSSDLLTLDHDQQREEIKRAEQEEIQRPEEVETEQPEEEEIAPAVVRDEYPEEEAVDDLLEEHEELVQEAEAVLEQTPIDYQERRDADEGEHVDDARGWVEAAPLAVLESETLPMEPLAEPVPEYRDELGADRVAEYAGSTGESESDELVSEAGPMSFEEQPEVIREPEVSVVDQSGLQEPEPPLDLLTLDHDQQREEIKLTEQEEIQRLKQEEIEQPEEVETEQPEEEEIAPAVVRDEYPEEKAVEDLLEEQEELVQEAEAVLEQESFGYPEHTDADEAEQGTGAEPSAILELEDARRESMEEAQPEPLGEPVEEHREEISELEAICQRLGRENEQLRNSLDQLRFENAALLIARQTSAPPEEASPSGARERELLEQQAASMRLEIEQLQAELSEARRSLDEAASIPHAKEALMATAEISCPHGAVTAADQASERHRELCRLQRLNTVLDLGLQKREHELSDLNEEIARLRRHLESTRIRFEKDLRECRQNCVILKKGKEIQEERCRQLERDNAELLQRLAWVQEEWKQLFSSHEPESKP
jgi:alkylated DNA repair dioxygenase AlkB